MSSFFDISPSNIHPLPGGPMSTHPDAATSDALLFSPNDVIDTDGVRIRITGIHAENSTLTAIVEAVDNTNHSARGFIAGSTLLFSPRGSNTWRIQSKGLPWYVLCVQDGKKRFDHYR